MKRVLTGAMAVLGVVASLGVAAVAGPAASAGAAAHGRIASVPLIGRHVEGMARSVHGQRDVTDVQSTNWSGYADTGDTFQAISGSWVEPTATCGAGALGLFPQAAYSAFWVGLDGYSSPSVEQTGTDSDCTSSGTPSYYAWYEMYPSGSVDLPTSTYPVGPGDILSGSVTYSAASSSYTLALSDLSAASGGKSGWTFSTTIAEAGLARSSAEWVAEAPESCGLLFCNGTNLANFGKVFFFDASATDASGVAEPISHFTDDAITMASSGTALATPSSLDASGNAFNITWNAAS